MSNTAWGAFEAYKQDLIDAPFGQQQAVKDNLFPSVSQLSGDYYVPETTLRSWLKKSSLMPINYDGRQRYSRQAVEELIDRHLSKRKGTKS